MVLLFSLSDFLWWVVLEGHKFQVLLWLQFAILKIFCVLGLVVCHPPGFLCSVGLGKTDVSACTAMALLPFLKILNFLYFWPMSCISVSKYSHAFLIHLSFPVWPASCLPLLWILLELWSSLLSERSDVIPNWALVCLCRRFRLDHIAHQAFKKLSVLYPLSTNKVTAHIHECSSSQ
jgi:hypothetical protein